MRYVLICLCVSMAIIFGIWLLSVKENFQGIARDVPSVTKKGKDALSQTPSTSLNDLLGKDIPLGTTEQKEKTGTEYFNEQFQERTQEKN